MAEKWIKKATDSMERRGTKGSFKRAAKKAGKSTSAMATSVLANPNASSKMKAKAQFAKNVMGGNTAIDAGSMKGIGLTQDPGDNLDLKGMFTSGSHGKDNLSNKSAFKSMESPRLENGSALTLKTQFRRKHRKQLLGQKTAFGQGKNYGVSDVEGM